MCCDFSKSFRPDKIPSHVFEIDEDFEKDEVRKRLVFWFFGFFYVFLLKKWEYIKKLISQGKAKIQFLGTVFWWVAFCCENGIKSEAVVYFKVWQDILLEPRVS